MGIEPHWPDVVQVDILLPGLPQELDGFPIAQMGDMHLGPYTDAEDVRRGVRIVNSLDAQIVVITGDAFYGNPDYARICAQELTALKAPLGVFAIAGNHERWIEAEKAEGPLREAGLTVLCNASFRIRVNEVDLWLLGMDDLVWGLGDLDLTLQGVPNDAFKVLLVHEPDFADEAAKAGINLQLSGHSHGGQICLPWLGPVMLPTMAQKYPSGLYQIGKMWLYTNRGLGVVKPPIRLNCRPEITLVRLHTI